MALDFTEPYWLARHYTVVRRGRGWLLAVSRDGTLVLRTAPGAATRITAAAALIRLDDPKGLAADLWGPDSEELPGEDLGDLFLEVRPPLSELEAEPAIDLEDAPF
jgi:hypothetical protein